MLAKKIDIQAGSQSITEILTGQEEVGLDISVNGNNIKINANSWYDQGN